jgi:IclR family KDG regulon transcriptional repressor
MAGRDYTIQSVDNALSVLESFCDKGEEINLIGISDKLHMNKSMVFRLLSTFERRGYIQKTDQKGHYRLGLTAYEMGRRFLRGLDLVNTIKPILTDIASLTNEAAYLVVREGSSILLLDMVDTALPVRIMPLVGNCYPLHLTAAGKVIQAFSKRGRSGRIKAADREEFQGIRKVGFCADQGAFGEGIASVAVPMIELEGALPASLCVLAPDFRLTEARIQEEILPVLFHATRTAAHGSSFWWPREKGADKRLEPEFLQAKSRSGSPRRKMGPSGVVGTVARGPSYGNHAD